MRSNYWRAKRWFCPFLYDWQSQSQYDLKESLENMAGVSVIEFDDKMADYNEDPVFERKRLSIRHLQKKRYIQNAVYRYAHYRLFAVRIKRFRSVPKGLTDNSRFCSSYLPVNHNRHSLHLQ